MCLCVDCFITENENLYPYFPDLAIPFAVSSSLLYRSLYCIESFLPCMSPTLSLSAVIFPTKQVEKSIKLCFILFARMQNDCKTILLLLKLRIFNKIKNIIVIIIH